jgi:hypothetical protein
MRTEGGRIVKTKKILEFVCDEVARQGHDINSLYDGFPRVINMVKAWFNALNARRARDNVTINDIQIWAMMIEPIFNARGFRTCQVTVGPHLAADWQDVPRLLQNLWDRMGSLSPDEFYVEFEKIHPFVDGNGRTGKILHNWLMNSLDDPVLVKDYFGGGNP